MNTAKQSRLFITIVWLCVLMVSLIYIRNNLSVVADIQQFMPDKSQDKRLQVLLHETQNGLASSLILLQIKSGMPEHLAQISQKLKIALEQKNELFESVINGDLRLNIKPFSSLLEHRYLLRQPDDFSVEGLHKAFADLLKTYTAGAPDELIEYLLIDPQKSFFHYLMGQSSQAQIEKVNGVWFDADKTSALLMVQLKSSGFNLDTLESAINEIRNTVKELDTTAKTTLTLSGPGVFAVASRDSIRATIKMVSWVLTLVVLILFWYGYRSIRLAFIAGIPLFTSIIVAISITQIIFGQLHGIVLAFGITMLGVCLDYPLHLFSHLQKNESAASALQRIWPTLRLGALTSVLAYVALVGTGFSGLTQLAVFSAIGLMVALAVTRWLIPCWISAEWINKRTVLAQPPFSNTIKIVLSTAVIGGSMVILLMQGNIWSTNISQISPVSESARNIDHQLRLALHATNVSHMFLVDGKKIDDVLLKTEQLKLAIQPAIEQGIISGVNASSDMLPTQQRQQYYQSLLPEKTILQENINSALGGLAFRKNTFEPFVESVSSAKNQTPVDYQTILDSPLGPSLKSMLFSQSDHWYSVIRVTGVENEQAFATWMKQSPIDLMSFYISLHDATSALMNSYLQSAWIRLLGVLSLVGLITIWLTSKRKAAVWLLVPVIAGVVVSLAVQSLLGNLLNIFHVLSLLLVIGMGFDYSLFFNRDWTHTDQLTDRTHAIQISAITTIVSFGTLGLSDTPILAAMGQTVSVGILSCYILAQRIAVPKKNSMESQHCLKKLPQ